MMGREPDVADIFSHMVTSVTLGLAYSAFIAPAPLLLLLALSLSWLSDKFALTRAAACGWVRGSHSAAQARVAGAASHWVGVAVVLHLAVTAAGFLRWPHGGDLCPKVHEGRQVYVDPIAHAQQIRHKVLDYLL
jgi:hypothetical protein